MGMVLFLFISKGYQYLLESAGSNWWIQQVAQEYFLGGGKDCILVYECHTILDHP